MDCVDVYTVFLIFYIRKRTKELIMDNIELCRRINNAWPETKDYQRAQDIINKAEAHWHKVGKKEEFLDLNQARSLLANKQLKAIRDIDKFYRRTKAFLEKGITIKFDDTIFNECSDLTAKEFTLAVSNTVVKISDEDARVKKIMEDLLKNAD